MRAAVAESPRMDRRFLLVAALITAAFMAAGLAGLDRPLAEWVHASGFEEARVFAWGLLALDTVSGLRLWIWAIGWVAIVSGAVALRIQRRVRTGYALIAAGLVQFAALQTMIAGKE